MRKTSHLAILVLSLVVGAVVSSGSPVQPANYLQVTATSFDPFRQDTTVTLTNTGDRAIQAWTVERPKTETTARVRLTRDLFRTFGGAEEGQGRLEPGASDQFTVPNHPPGSEPAPLDVTVETVVFADGSFVGAPSNAHRVLRSRAAARQEIASWVERLAEARLRAGAAEDARGVLDDLVGRARGQTHAASLPTQHLIATNLAQAVKAADAHPQHVEGILDFFETTLRTGLLSRTPFGSPLFDNLILPQVEIQAPETTPRLVHTEGSGESDCSITTSRSRLTSRNCPTFNITETWSYECSAGGSGSGTLAGRGECFPPPPPWEIDCPPFFTGPDTYTSGSDLIWDRNVEHQRVLVSPISSRCENAGTDNLDFTCECPNEPPEPPPAPDQQDPGEPQGGESPIVLELGGDGFAFSGPAPPVYFDIDADGRRERLAWLAAGGTDAFLALDRNGNGMIDDASELFGNHTEQPKAEDRHGYRALAVFDDPRNGGDGDGDITPADGVFGALALWFDRDRDGVSQPSELRSLAEEGIAALDLAYWESKARDEHGNRLRYWSSYRASDGRQGFTVDVFFVLAD